MTRTALLLLAVISTSLLGWTAGQVSISCSWTKVMPDGQLHNNFLRQDSSPPRLYHSVWSQERTLLSCSWSDDAAVIQDYSSLCVKRTQEFSEHPDGNLNLNLMLEAEDQCVSVSVHGEHTGERPARSVGGLPAAMHSQGQDERSEVSIHQRVKRGFIVPGTLWCGSGNKAPSYEDLGAFSDTDSCCREHDQCKHTILSFHSEFGVFNTNIFTMSHCDCDNKFRSCLMEANDSISHVVGYTFFNLLKMHCFEFSHRLQCMERNWFGMCKETKMALYAEVYPPTLFEYTSPTEVSMNSTSSIINTTTPAELQGSSMSDPQFFSSLFTEAASTIPTPSTSSPSASMTADASTAAAPSSGSPPASITLVTNVSSSTVTSPSGRPTGSAAESTDSQKNILPPNIQTPTERDTDLSVKLLSCGVYKDLDECRNRILPQENRFGLHNPEPRTLYHCNCTTRLFQTLAEQRRLTEVHALLLEHVSQSCFLPQDCTAGETCTAVVVKAEFPPVAHRSGAEVEEQHHLQAVKLKVRRPKTSRAKRKDGAVRLHKLCLRMSRRKMNKSRKHGQNAARQVVSRREPV